MLNEAIANESLPEQASLSVALRTGTLEAHKTAERAAFMRGFLRGILSQETYRSLLERLYPVYRELEYALVRHRKDPVVGALCRSELFRLQSLQADIRFFDGEPGAVEHLSAATRNYVRRIREVSEQCPELLAAHAYTRYLGDLSGGQVLGKLMRKSLGLREGQGDHFYRFKGIDDAKAYKTDYKSMLDALPLSAVSVEDQVEEARLAFAFNRALFDELEGSAFQALVQTMAPTLSRWIYRYSRVAA